MKEKLKKIVDTFHKYNSEHMAAHAFGLRDDVVYDALVIAPSFHPYRLHMEDHCKVTTLKEGAYIAGYLVEKDDLKIIWIKIGSSAGNVIDHLAVCAELQFRQLIFIGAVGALKEEFRLGDVCTPVYSLSGSYADAYLMKDSIGESMLFTKVEPDLKYVDKVVLTEQDIGTDDIHQIWSDIRQFLSDDKVQAEIPIRREAVYYACENVPDGWVLILAGNGAERFQKRGLVCVPEPTDGEVVEKYIEDHR